MNENIDLTKILEGCPKGTKLYSTIFGGAKFDRIEHGHIFLKCMNVNFPFTFCITKDGKYNTAEDAECILFPSKDQRDWSKFERFWDKPKVERFDPKTLQPFDKILARDVKEEEWHCDFFSYMADKTPFQIQGIYNNYRYCIPYNNETKHLIGKSDDCPEYYKWWKK